MLSHPEDELDISPVPTVAQVVGEETPGMVIVLIGEEDADPAVTFLGHAVVVSPDDAEVERTGRSHDGDVWKNPLAVVVREGVDGLQEEWVTGNSAHNIVRDTSGICATNPSWVGKKRVETTIAALDDMLVMDRGYESEEN